MYKNGHPLYRRHVVDYGAEAIEQMGLYCAAHPDSPAAMHRPKLFFRNDLWIALLGPAINEGIVGIGPNVAAALRAFDAQYVGRLPNETINPSIEPERSPTADPRRLPELG